MQPEIPTIEPEGFLSGLSPGAILFGAVIDIVASFTSFLLLTLLLQPPPPSPAAQPEAAPERIAPADPAPSAGPDLYDSPEFLLGALVLGLAATVLGAFVGARLAGTLFVRHGGWIAVVSTVLMLPFLLLPSADAAATPTWYDIAGWVLILPAGMAGGALAALAARSRSDSPS